MKKLKLIFVIVCMMTWVGGGAFGAVSTNNGCDTEDYVDSKLALCSTHVFNIGMDKNPESDVDRQFMKDVIALKTTIMTQQMKKQYDYLDAMVRRFKTQLQKSVLQTKLQASGAGGGSGSSVDISVKSNDRNIHITGVSNCNNMATTVEVFQCLRTNYNVISNLANSKSSMDQSIRKQVATDFAIMCDSYPATGAKPTKCSGSEVCTKAENMSNREKFRDCLDALNGGIRTGYEAANARNNQNNRNNNGWGD